MQKSKRKRRVELDDYRDVLTSDEVLEKLLQTEKASKKSAKKKKDTPMTDKPS